MSLFYYLLVLMSKNIPDSCWDNDPSAPWNDIQVTYNYRLYVNLDGILFASEIIREVATFGYFEIKSPDDWSFLENDIYQVIEDNLGDEIKECNYKIDLLNWSYNE